jgi:hypothetical protein
VAKGLGIHIGLNSVDPAGYEGWDGQLNACEYDAQDMAKIAQSRAIESRMLLTADATADAVSSAISDAAQQLESGDFLFLTYSGHGGQLTDVGGVPEEDLLDETWCLYDRQLIDDELYSAWSQFQPGVRILVLSDSCHSGSVLKLVPNEQGVHVDDGVVIRAVPDEIQGKVNRAHRDEIKAIKKAHPGGDDVDIGAHVLLISGCQDDQTSGDGPENGVFTGALLQIWDDGNFDGDYPAFREQIVARIKRNQTPELSTAGAPSDEFKSQQPFTV